jgi:hypothetical protein
MNPQSQEEFEMMVTQINLAVEAVILSTIRS